MKNLLRRDRYTKSKTINTISSSKQDMIITLAGRLGSGKSTVGNKIAEIYHLKKYSTGDFMREMAKERGVSLLELSKMAETDKSIDKELDDRQVKFGQVQDNFIIDARLGWYFIPQSIKIFLDVSYEEAARRIYTDKVSDRSAESGNDSIEQTLHNIKTRETSERKRYKEYYGLDYMDLKNYDLVVDTTGITLEEVIRRIKAYVDKHKK